MNQPYTHQTQAGLIYSVNIYSATGWNHRMISFQLVITTDCSHQVMMYK
jgi:hypothetical protein